MTEASGQAGFLLSPMQQGMLYESLRYPRDAGVYIEQVVCVLSEPLEIATFQQSWEQTVHLHEILRTCFSLEGLPGATQHVVASVPLALHFENWSSLSRVEQDNRLKTYLDSDRCEGFEFTRAPLFRIAVFQYGSTEFRCVWTVHHTLADGRTMALVLAEVFGRYDALREGKAWEPLSAAPAYRLYIEWLDGLPVDKAETFWRSQMGKLESPPELQLPRDEGGTGYGEIRLVLEHELTAAIDAFAGTHDVTANTVIQGAWAILLSRYCGQEEVMFGATKALRHWHSQADSAVGLYINTLPLKVRVPFSEPVGVWMKGLRDQWTAMRPYEHTSLAKIRSWSGLRGSAGLFETSFVFERGSLNDLVQKRGGPWPHRRFELREKTPQLLTLAAYWAERALLTLEYDRTKCDDACANQILNHVHTLLASIVAQSDGEIGNLEMLTEADRRLIETQWQTRQPETSTPKPVHFSFEDTAARDGERNAVEQEKIRWSYRELNERSNRIAHFLIARGIEPEARVGLCMPRAPEMIAAILGILKAGAAYVPMDPAYPPERLDFMVQDARIAALVTTDSAATKFSRCPALTLRVDTDGALLGACVSNNPPRRNALGDLAYVIYTSGSTGKPKGVLIEHGSLACFTRSALAVYGIGTDDRVLQFASVSFDAAAEEIFPCLSCGGTLVLRTEEMLTSAAVFGRCCRQMAITVLDLPTAYWHLLCDELERADFPGSVRLVLIGGEAARAEKLERWRRIAPAGLRVINTYGPTETTVVATYSDITHSAIDNTIPIGRPLPHVEARVLDPWMRPVAPRLPGHLCISGPQLARGYLDRPEQTASAFVMDPKSPGRRWYKTGDRARHRADGELLYLGRFDRQVKIRGFRVEMGEVESVLRKHPSIQDAAVSVYEPTPGAIRLVGYLVANAPTRGDEIEKVKAWLADSLPKYMHPTAFVLLDYLPQTPTGKTDYRALPAPAASEMDSPGARVEPRDAVERVLCEMWAEVLGVPAVGIHDNFFDLGGQSLLAVVLAGRIEKRLGKNLPLVRLYENPTVAQLAAQWREGAKTPQRALRVVQPQGKKRPLFFVGSTSTIPYCVPVLGYDQPLYSLNIFGLEPEEGPIESMTVEDVARKYIAEMRAVQAEGPYRLGAYCRDGLVALEMARQLEMEGQYTELMALIDTFWTSQGQYTSWERHLRNLWTYRWPYIAGKVTQNKRMLRERWNRFVSRREAARPPRPDKEVPRVSRDILFINAYYDAVAKYVPRSFSGKVTLLIASEWGLFEAPEWNSLAGGGVEIRQVRSCHHTIWEKPFVDELARHFKECLDRLPAQPDQANR